MTPSGGYTAPARGTPVKDVPGENATPVTSPSLACKKVPTSSSAPMWERLIRRVTRIDRSYSDYNPDASF